MIEDIRKDAEQRMTKTVDALETAFGRIRTGRANPAILDGIQVDYYGNMTPLNQVANIIVEDARTLAISPWEKNMVAVIEKAVLKSDLGITPASTSDLVRVPLPPLTEENRRDLAKQARHEAEQARVSVRNIRRDAIADIREAVREKAVAEDDAHRGEEGIQKLTDRFVAEVDKALGEKEADLMEV